ncbi:hypothetical protein KBX37_10115 [Micromonospora sp. U56]|uniref:hypothetical protein n=1 Tax=Micromonospora sp. U56 TaxID=2824900 RepID=UPI001B374293|nr:hypothetical protein [Micromonospora sp. U56]MBQ0893445.1 hypothetical protein [Micromonospora sp. U56]
MTDPTPAEQLTTIQTLQAELAALRAPAPADPAPSLPTLPKPTTGEGPAVSPAPTSGLAPAFQAPAFDPADIAAQMPPRPVTASGVMAGDLREPAAPLAPPPGVEVPEDHAAALAEADARYQAWRDAVEAVDEYADTARDSRTRRADAIREAGRAAAQGKPRPAIPTATSEDEEAAEVAILSAVVEARRREADAATKRADKIAAKYAPEWSAQVVASFGPALAAASEAVRAALDAVGRAEGVLGVASAWRAIAVAEELERRGVRVNDHGRARIMSDLLDATKSQLFTGAESASRNPVALLSQVRDALGTLSQCDAGAVPSPDTLLLPGGFEASREVWRSLYDSASPGTKQRYRDRHTGGRPLAHEREG